MRKVTFEGQLATIGYTQAEIDATTLELVRTGEITSEQGAGIMSETKPLPAKMEREAACEVVTIRRGMRPEDWD